MIRRFALWLSSFVVLGLGLFSDFSVVSGASRLHLTAVPVPILVRDVDYLQVDGKVFQATIYQPEGAGPFPVILDVHGGAWVREDVQRNEHELLAKALAGMGLVIVSIDYRQGPQNQYPDSIIDVNYAMRWLRANAANFNGSATKIGALGSSSG